MRQTTIFAFDPLFFNLRRNNKIVTLVCSRLEHPACQTPSFVAIEFTGLRQAHNPRDGRTDRETYISMLRQVDRLSTRT